MRRTRRAVAVTVVGVVVSTLLAACSSGSGSNQGADATSATIPAFTYGVEAIPPTLDVANDYNSTDMAVMGLVSQPLEIPNLDGTFTPGLASKVSQPNDTTLVYDLRDDVTFSDGTPFTSADVVWTIEHLRGATTQTASELTNFKTVKATGEHQVTITLARSNPAQRGAFAIISFIQQKAYGEKSGKDLGTPKAPPIGTGPYVVDTFSSNTITMKRNARFSGTKPAVDTFTVTAISDDNAGQLAMRSGELDGVAVNDIKSTSLWKGIPGATTYSSPTLYLDYITLNLKAKPFDDIHVRRAVAYATDVDGLLKANYGDQATKALGMTPPQAVTNVEPGPNALADLAQTLPKTPFSLDEARKELSLSAYPQGFTSTYEYYSPAGKLVGISLAANLKKIGVTLELKSRKLTDYIGDLFAGKVPDIGFFSISAVVPDPSSWYLYIVGKDNPYNASRYSTPATEKALAEIDGTDKAKRWAGAETIIKSLADDLPYIGLAQPNYVFALGDGVTFATKPDFVQMTSGNWVNLLRSTR